MNWTVHDFHVRSTRFYLIQELAFFLEIFEKLSGCKGAKIETFIPKMTTCRPLVKKKYKFCKKLPSCYNNVLLAKFSKNLARNGFFFN